MRNALLLHGTGGTPTNFWFPSVRKYFESAGYNVVAPQLPNADRPVLTDWLDVALNVTSFDAETIIIAHSAACPLVLSILERIDAPIEQAICVAGFYQPREGRPQGLLMLQDQYDWRRIKENAREILFINSDDDPWACNDAQARVAAAELSATLIVPAGQGHMGSDTFDQPYDEFPLLTRLISQKFF